MKKEYDFSKGERGRFYRPRERLEIPVYLDKDVAEKLSKGGNRGPAKIAGIVNGILRKELELIDMMED